jgi:hypothetical protein
MFTDPKKRILVAHTDGISVYDKDGTDISSFPADQRKLKPPGICYKYCN